MLEKSREIGEEESNVSLLQLMEQACSKLLQYFSEYSWLVQACLCLVKLVLHIRNNGHKLALSWTIFQRVYCNVPFCTCVERQI